MERGPLKMPAGKIKTDIYGLDALEIGQSITLNKAKFGIISTAYFIVRLHGFVKNRPYSIECIRGNTGTLIVYKREKQLPKSTKKDKG